MKIALFCLSTLLIGAQDPVPMATPPPVPDATGPIVRLETSEGVLRIRMYSERSPLSVENFLSYVRDGHYTGTIFHRVIRDFMVQGGGLTPDLTERPTGPPVRNEARNMLRNSRGTVALARTQKADSATAQFYVNLRDNHLLDFGIAGAGYSVFGQVIEGMDVVDRIASTATTTIGPYSDVPVEPITIVGAVIEETTPPTQADSEAPTQPGP
jgi:cyclophilin family peptidyl-prolyl cis-trans isomerase